MLAHSEGTYMGIEISVLFKQMQQGKSFEKWTSYEELIQIKHLGSQITDMQAWALEISGYLSEIGKEEMSEPLQAHLDQVFGCPGHWYMVLELTSPT